MGRIILIFIFYIFSYLTFSPAGLYALWKKPFKNKSLGIVIFIIFALKLIFDFFIYKDVLLTDKAGFILTAFILVFNYILYILAFRKITITELAEKEISVEKATSVKEETSTEAETAPANEEIVVSKTENIAIPIEETVNEEITETISVSGDKSTSKPKTMLQEVNQYVNTGEVFSFYYKGTSDKDYKVRNIIVNNISNNHTYSYVEGIDIDLDAPRTFRTDRMLSLTHELDKLSESEIENLKTFYENSKETKKLIEDINSARPKKYFDIPEDIDIEAVLSKGGFIKKDGKNCQIFDASFEYLGSKIWNITSLKKRHPYLLTPKKPVFLASDGCFLYDFYTYSSTIIEKLDNYDEEEFQKAEKLLEHL